MTTETGAYGIVLAAVELNYGLVAVARADTPSGADYYVGPPHDEFLDFELLIRLEVSGTDEGNAAEVARRLDEKCEQASRGDPSLPAVAGAVAGVVGFEIGYVALTQVEEPTRVGV